MKKPELLVTPHDLSEILPLIEAGADAFILGEERFALRLAGNFSREELSEALNLIHAHQKKAYVAINAVFVNELIQPLTDYLISLKGLPVDGLRFSDPGAYMVAKEVVPEFSLQWSSETMGTNFFTANYWFSRGIDRVVLAPEIEKEAVLQTKAEAKGEIEVLVHGAVSMFHSRRELIGNYMKFQGDAVSSLQTIGDGYTIFDPERDLYYPIFEDSQGTHILNGSDICMIDDLGDLIDGGMDSLRIDGILKSREYRLNTAAAYRMAIDLAINDREKYGQVGRALYKKMEGIQPPNRKLDRGFFYKPSIYKHQ
ncbi:MAG: U32 family peptidase [Turicibacter sp.]|nr:U32 family peptidase [Turicibacter sp.]